MVEAAKNSFMRLSDSPNPISRFSCFYFDFTAHLFVLYGFSLYGREFESRSAGIAN